MGQGHLMDPSNTKAPSLTNAEFERQTNLAIIHPRKATRNKPDALLETLHPWREC